MTEMAYPMAQPLPTNGTSEARIARGRLIASTPGAVEQVTPITFTVKSQSGVGVYRVERNDTAATCTCPDATKHDGTGCKHIAAVRFYLERQTVGPSGEVVSERVPITHTQAWTAYNGAQKAEVRLFDQLLSDLVADVVDPRPVQVRGQPRLPMSDMIFASVQKVYSQLSCRRSYSLFGFAAERGQIVRPPSYSMSSILLNREDVTPILHDMIAKVALPLAALEDGFAVDSSGFRTTCYGDYCQERHGPSRVNKWLKAHIVIGIRTHVIPKVVITDSNGADSPQFPALVNGLIEAGFVMKEVYADKGYLSRDNFEVAGAVGATPYIAFKANSKGRAHGSPWWKKMYHLFQANREEWESHYHLRSNVEAGFAAVKKKLGETLKSKNPVAQTNELLAKVLSYNLTVLIHEMYEHGVVPGFITGSGVKVIGPEEVVPALL
jgi:transposase